MQGTPKNNAMIDISDELALRMLECMYRIRFTEERLKDLYRSGTVYGAIHLYIGEEAVAAGACTALEKEDYITSTHRGHGHAIAKGIPLKYVLAELMGKKTGSSGGHGGSMHIFSKEHGHLGGNGIVGAGLPIALGAAYSARYRKSGQVTVCFFGDGALNHGTFHESLNMAGLWKLPVVYLCENNYFSATTPIKVSTSVQDMAKRGSVYNMASESIDGNDVEAVYQSIARAAQRAREGQGPSFIEARTYRIEGHCMVLPQAHDPAVLESWLEQDPLLRYEQKLIERGTADADRIEQSKSSVKEELAEAEQFALDSPEPEIETFLETFYD